MKDFLNKRSVGIALSIVGIVVAVFALIYGTTKNSSTTFEVQVAANKATFVSTAPGVLDLFTDAKVEINATAPNNGEILWAIGRSEDVAAYIGDSSQTQITGLESRKEAKIAKKEAKPEKVLKDQEALKSGTLSLDKTDLWDKFGREKKTLNIKYDAIKGAQRAFIATSTAGIAPDLKISWEAKIKTFPTVQIVIFGILISLVGIYLLFTENQSRARAEYFRNREADRKMKRAEKAAAMTQILPVFAGNLAAPEVDREIQREHTEGAFGSAILPGTSRTSALRNRPLVESDRIILPISELDVENVAHDEIDSSAQFSESGKNIGENDSVVGLAESTEPAESAESAESIESADELSTDNQHDALNESDVDWKTFWNFALEKDESKNE